MRWGGRRSCRRDRHEVGAQAEVFEDVCSDPQIGDEREHAQGIAATRALGDVVAENPAQQSGAGTYCQPSHASYELIGCSSVSMMRLAGEKLDG